ncbi:MAG: hypothetical protein PWP03_600 [Candidatus Woesearchaeota archaeon]|nr:hypothetical protein [Candidatus Woesearchaeota archaeon]MDN5327962.1 hypothetical protein [Candidatus Woesearchaeota archaeon]
MIKMALKCEICNSKIERTFLGKILGTVIKDERGKLHYVCSNCQAAFNNDKVKMLEEIQK